MAIDPTSLSPAAAYQASVQAELAKRLDEHAEKIQQLKVQRTFAVEPKPVVLLANGDSWFDYPVDGTDIVGQLNGLLGLKQPPIVARFAVAGDTTLQSMGLERQKAIRQAISDPNRYGHFEGILYSGGGDDIAGDSFWMWLNSAVDVSTNPTDALNDRFSACVNLIIKSYDALCSQRDRLMPGAPIFTHVYDFAIPDGHALQCLLLKFGPWMQPGFRYQGWPDAGPTEHRAAQIVELAIRAFAKALHEFAKSKDNFFIVDTWHAVQSDGWANELHPKPPGFAELAKRFLETLKDYPAFRGRIF